MNLNQEISSGHMRRYARGPATFQEASVRDYSHSNGRITSRHGFEYAAWVQKIQSENNTKYGWRR